MDKTKINLDIQLEEITPEKVQRAFANLNDEDIPQLDPDLMYVRFIMCHEGSNANGDTFLKDVLYRAQATPKNKPINWEHGEPKIGTILDSTYREDASGKGYIEAIGAIWKFLHPEIAEEVKAKASSGQLRLSMECYFKDVNYSYAGQLYDQQTATELKLDEYLGREYMGNKVFRIFQDVVFGGVAVVEKPADKEAVFLAVANQVEDNTVIDTTADDQHVRAIAEIIRNTNDMSKKSVDNETLDAVTVGKFARAFDDAKSRIVSKLNKEHLEAKSQTLQDIKKIVNELLSEVSYISNDYYVGRANEENIEYTDNEELDLKLSDDPDKEVVVDKGGNEEMEENKATQEELEQKEEKDEIEEKFKDVDKEDYKGQAEAYKKQLDDLKGNFSTVEANYKGLEQKYNDLVQKVEASEKEEKAKTRMAELDGLGIQFSEARFEKEKDKVSAMDDESFADYKEFLSEIAVKASEKEEDKPEEKEEKEEKIEVEKPEQAQANLVVENEAPKVINPFGHLSE